MLCILRWAGADQIWDKTERYISLFTKEFISSIYNTPFWDANHTLYDMAPYRLFLKMQMLKHKFHKFPKFPKSLAWLNSSVFSDGIVCFETEMLKSFVLNM